MKFHNNVAAFSWVFSGIFLAGCSLFTYILVRDGSSQIQINPPQITSYYPSWFMPAMLGVFWLVGWGLAIEVSKKPCIQVKILPDKSVSIKRRYPFRQEVYIVRGSELNPAQVIKSQDSESSPYFFVRIFIPDGNTFDIAEGHDRNFCEAVCIRFNNALID